MVVGLMLNTKRATLLKKDNPDENGIEITSEVVKGVLSQRMRALRTKKGCTQKEAAVLLSMSPTAVASWEQKPKTEH